MNVPEGGVRLPRVQYNNSVQTLMGVNCMLNYSIVVKNENLPKFIDRIIFDPIRHELVRVPLMLISSQKDISRTRQAVYHHPKYGDTVVRLVPTLFHLEKESVN